jgi:hypothetical protein
MNRVISCVGAAESAIQIHRSEQCFKRVDQQRLLLSPSGFLFSPSKMEMASEVELLGVLHEIRGTDKEPFQFREFSFFEIRILSEERVADDESKNRIAKEFELFVIFACALFVGVRTVGESLAKKGLVPELVAQGRLEFLEVPYC